MGVNLHFQAISNVLLGKTFVRVGVEQIVNFLVIKLNVLHSHCDLVLALLLAAFLLDLGKELSDGPWYHSFFVNTCLESVI